MAMDPISDNIKILDFFQRTADLNNCLLKEKKSEQEMLTGKQIEEKIKFLQEKQKELLSWKPEISIIQTGQVRTNLTQNLLLSEIKKVEDLLKKLLYLRIYRFDRLPKELILYIASFLDPIDRLQLSCVNRFLRFKSLQEPQNWLFPEELKISLLKNLQQNLQRKKLFSSGFYKKNQDVFSTHLTTLRRLDSLKERFFTDRKDFNIKINKLGQTFILSKENDCLCVFSKSQTNRCYIFCKREAVVYSQILTDIYIHDMEGNESHPPLTGHHALIICLYKSPTNQHLYSGSLDGTIKEWDITGANKSCIHTFTAAHKGRITGLCTYKNYLFSISNEDKTCKIWNIETKKWVEELTLSEAPEKIQLQEENIYIQFARGIMKVTIEVEEKNSANDQNFQSSTDLILENPNLIQCFHIALGYLYTTFSDNQVTITNLKNKEHLGSLTLGEKSLLFNKSSKIIQSGQYNESMYFIIENRKSFEKMVAFLEFNLANKASSLNS